MSPRRHATVHETDAPCNARCQTKRRPFMLHVSDNDRLKARVVMVKGDDPVAEVGGDISGEHCGETTKTTSTTACRGCLGGDSSSRRRQRSQYVGRGCPGTTVAAGTAAFPMRTKIALRLLPHSPHVWPDSRMLSPTTSAHTHTPRFTPRRRRCILARPRLALLRLGLRHTRRQAVIKLAPRIAAQRHVYMGGCVKHREVDHSMHVMQSLQAPATAAGDARQRQLL
jgi:hypothetical protein